MTDPLQHARDELASSLCAGEPGGRVLGRWADAVRTWIVERTTAPIEAAADKFGPMALTVVGALARSELGPHSDVDLVLLMAQPPSASAPETLDELVASLVHPMWDSGLRPNLVVDDPESWLARAADDLTLATGLFDVQWLAGDASLVDELRAQAHQRFGGDNRSTLLQRLEDEVDQRHQRYGGTVYLVEPDLKYGPGGLRDLAVVHWCLQATFGTSDLAQLAADGSIRAPLADMMVSARDSLLRLRAALQLAAHRTQDRFAFQYQELVPPLLGLVASEGTEDAQLVDAIEHAMQGYFRAAHTVARYGRRLRERCVPPPLTPVEPPLRIDDRFRIQGGKLDTLGVESFAATPLLALEALTLSRDYGVPLSGRTFDGIAEAVAAPAAFALADESVAQRRILDLLCDLDDARNPSALDLCNELGVLERVVPELGPIRGRMQHDAHHVYTVDIHTLQAISMLKRIGRGEHNKDYPLATALHLELDDPRVLYVATLVHDAGKALAGDQCETGAGVATHVATRLGMSEADAARCSLLVREHLTMPLLSQKRDLSDPLLVEEFGARVDRQALKELYLLSLVDTASVRPGNLTSWKQTLLDELYLLTAAFLSRGRPRPTTVAGDGELEDMPERYYSLYHRQLRLQHARAVERLLAEDRRVLLDLDTGSGALRLTMIARDRPGLLAQVASVLDDYAIEVMAADVFTHPGTPPTAVDVFRVVPREGPEQGIDVETLTEIEQRLDIDALPDFSAPLTPRGRPLGAARVVTSVAFDSDPSGERTIVDVECASGPGTLRRMTHAFAAQGIEIEVARCSGEADRAQNVFYVRKLEASEREALDHRLRADLELR